MGHPEGMPQPCSITPMLQSPHACYPASLLQNPLFAEPRAYHQTHALRCTPSDACHQLHAIRCMPSGAHHQTHAISCMPSDACHQVHVTRCMPSVARSQMHDP
eukprot:496029-Pelagomonas_calceolata.AAC.2